jgi:hypothetical protein
MTTRIVKFHPTHSLGRLYLSEHNRSGGWVEYIDAQGEVSVPPDMNLELWVTNDGLADLTPLTRLEPDDLYALIFACTPCERRRFAIHPILDTPEWIALWETDIGDLGLGHISGMASLRWLDIGDTKVIDEGLAQLRSLENLQELALLNDGVGDNGMVQLGGFGSLQRLDLMSTRVSDASIKLLSRLTGLRSLRVYQTQISEIGYEELSRALPDCQIWYYRSNDL